MLRQVLFIIVLFFSVEGYTQTGIGATPTTVAGIGPGKFEVTGVGDFTLKIKGDSYTGFGVQSFRDNSSDHAIINLFGARGTMASPTSMLYGDAVSTISTRAYTGSGYTPITTIQSFYTGFNQGTIIFATNGGSSTTERMRINHDGYVGIGTNSPTARLNIVGGGIKIHNGFSNSTSRPALTTTSIGNYEIRGVGSITGSSQEDLGDDGFLRLSAGGGTSTSGQTSIDLSGYSSQGDMNNNIVMRTSGSERLRISNTGNVGIGTSSPNTKLHVQSSDPTTVYIESSASDNYGLIRLNANTNQNWVNNWHELIVFEKQGVQMGNIGGASNGTAVTYGSNSDYRLKTDFKDFNALDIVNKIKVYDFAWKIDSSRMYGFIAHELQNELPYAVTGKKDQVNKEGKMVPQTVDYGKLTPILLKAIQEQDLKIKEQQMKIESLIKRLEKIENQ